MAIISCLCLLFFSSAALGNCAAILNSAVDPSGDEHKSATALQLHSSTLTATAATEDNQTVRMDSDNDYQNQSSPQQHLSTAEEEEQTLSAAAIDARELQGVISNIVSQMRPQVSNPLSSHSYDPRQQQQAPRVGILKTDNRQATNNQEDSRNLVRNVVSTVSNAAANIGNAVLGTNNNNNRSPNSSGGLLLQGRVVDRVMSAVRNSGYDQKKIGGLVGVVAGVGDNLLDGPLIGKLLGNEQRRSGGLLG